MVKQKDKKKNVNTNKTSLALGKVYKKKDKLLKSKNQIKHIKQKIQDNDESIKVKKKKFKKNSTFPKNRGNKDSETKPKNSFKKKGNRFSGDISEEDIDSDDNLSLDEEDLPTPPDETATEDESSSEGEQEEVVENKIEIVPPQDELERRTIFVGNLPKTVAKTKLKKWFSKYGTVESVRLRCAPLSDPSIPKKIAVITKAFHEDRSNIYSYIRFTTIEGATNALAANGQQFDSDHHLRVDMAGVKGGDNKRYDDKKAIFVGNLPFNAEEEQLRDHFADCGDISSIRIIRDKYTAVGKGFAYINFVSRHSVRLALEKNSIKLDGRALRVQKAVYNQENTSKKVHTKNQEPRKKQLPSQIYKQIRLNRNSASKLKTNKNEQTTEKNDYQGLLSQSKLMPKKISKKKKKLRKRKEILKKVLSNDNNKRKNITF